MRFDSLITESNCDTFSNIRAFKELRKSYPDWKEIVVILDNARYNHSTMSSEEVSLLNITSFFLPPYSPNLNLIERVWKFMKSEVLKNIYYPTFDGFWNAIVDFCWNFDKYQSKIKSIMSQKFQILKEA